MDVKVIVENCCLRRDHQWNIVPLATDLRALPLTGGHVYNLKSLAFLVNLDYDGVQGLFCCFKVEYQKPPLPLQYT